MDYSHPIVYNNQDAGNTNPSGRFSTEQDFDSGSGDNEMDTACLDELSRLNLSDHIAVPQERNVNNSSLPSDVEQSVRTDSAMDSGDSTSQTVEEKFEEPKYPVSFYDLMWMIENGEKIPGVDDLDVQPTNETPTASNVNRLRKPWEL